MHAWVDLRHAHGLCVGLHHRHRSTDCQMDRREQGQVHFSNHAPPGQNATHVVVEKPPKSTPPPAPADQQTQANSSTTRRWSTSHEPGEAAPDEAARRAAAHKRSSAGGTSRTRPPQPLAEGGSGPDPLSARPIARLTVTRCQCDPQPGAHDRRDAVSGCGDPPSGTRRPRYLVPAASIAAAPE